MIPVTKILKAKETFEALVQKAQLQRQEKIDTNLGTIEKLGQRNEELDTEIQQLERM